MISLLSFSRGFISGFYSHSGESVGLGACWCPMVMKRCCNLTYGLVFQAKRLGAVAATRDLHPVMIVRSCRLGFRPALWSKHLDSIRKGSIIFATPPEMVQQNRQLAGHGNHCTLLPTLASASGQFQAPPP